MVKDLMPPELPKDTSVNLPNIKQRGGGSATPPPLPEGATRRMIDDLWDDHNLDKLPPTLAHAASHLAEAAPSIVRKNMRRVLAGVVFCIEGGLMAGLLLLAAQQGILRVDFGAFRNFDILAATHWDRLGAYYEAGHQIPWLFALALVLPAAAWGYSLYRLVLLNAQHDMKHTERVMLPLKKLGHLMLIFLRWLRHILFRPVRATLFDKRPRGGGGRKKSSPPTAPSGDDDLPESGPSAAGTGGGGAGHLKTSYQVGIKDPSFKSPANVRPR